MSKGEVTHVRTQFLSIAGVPFLSLGVKFDCCRTSASQRTRKSQACIAALLHRAPSRVSDDLHLWLGVSRDVEDAALAVYNEVESM